ncbi:phage tail protein [Pseudomonas putida]|uniref:phage tail protein n=1 Tax=Pseudomonas putida TaxID=303 RepID=UPI002363E059|nr:phage tail protein [Pseudomonas putida]MDD2005102.1 phage tail protein [Pseudomonas putida]
MIWLMAVMFLLSLVMIATMKTKVPSPSAAGLEDFSLPSASERPVQVLAGTRRLSGPNVIWYGDLRTSKIVKKVKGLFSTTKTTVGYRYYMGIQLGICHGQDVVLREVKFGDQVAWCGESTGGAIRIDKPSLFGGDEDGTGGVSGTLRFYGGSLVQTANDYLVGLLGSDVVSPIRGVAYAVFEGMYIGNASTPEAVSFVCSRFPKSPSTAPESQLYERIGQDANPAYFLHEIITHPSFGADIAFTTVDNESFVQAAKTLYAEGLGISCVIDTARTAADVIEDIKKIIQCSLNTDPATGALKLRLIRNDYDIEAVPEIGPWNIKNLSNFSRGSLDTAINEVKLKYISRGDDYNERTVIAQNNGLRIHKGDSDGQTISMPMISVRETAAKIAQREISAISVPLASCVAECHRSMSDAEVGDVVKLTWPAQKIEKIVMRVTAVDLGAPTDGAVRLTLIQDVFGVFESFYTAGNEAKWQKPSFEPQDVTRYDIIEAPTILTPSQTTRSILVVAEKPGVAQDYRLQTKGSSEGSWLDAGVQQFTPLCVLSQALTANRYVESAVELGGDVGELDDYTGEEVRRGLGLLLVSSVSGMEWMSYESVSRYGSDSATVGVVNRGLFNTKPLVHPVGARVWCVSEGFAVTHWQYAAGEVVQLKMLVGTQTGRQEFDDAALRSFTVGARNDEPWTPGRVRINGQEGGFITGPATVTWKRRNGGAPAVVFDGDDVSYGDALTRIVVKSGGAVVKDVAGISGEAWTFVDEKDINGGSFFEQLDFELRSHGQGLVESAPTVVSSSR